VVDAVVHRVVRRVVEAHELPRLEQPAENGDAVEVEAELGGDPRRGEDDEHGGERDPEPVTAGVARRLGAVGEQREDEDDRDAGGGHDVDPPRVEIRLLHHSRHGEDPAEDGCDHRRRAGASRKAPGDDREHRERDERGGEVEVDEHAAEPGAEARAADVVELIRRQARIRHEHRHEGGGNERPDDRYLTREPGHGHGPARYT
jgi:hypothetical protein